MNLKEITNEVKKFIDDSGKTQEDIAQKTGINQSQISRIVNGQFKKVSKNVKLLCEYAEIDFKSKRTQPNPAKNAVLMKAIAEVWDGTDSNANAIAKVILSLKNLS